MGVVVTSFLLSIVTAIPITMAVETLIAPFPVYSIKEIKFASGVAGATSTYSNSWLPANAFKPQQPIGKGWHVGPRGGPSPNFPLMIWYDLKTHSVLPSEVSLQPAQFVDKDPNYLQKTPSSYQFVGSNAEVCDDDSTWTVLCEDLSDLAWRSQWEVRYCKVKPEINERFRCLGIRMLKNRSTAGWANVRNIRVWERKL